MTLDATTIVAGNLTDDPELRFTPAGVPVCHFSIAVNHRRPDGAGGWADNGASFFRCVAWRELAENLAESLGKGDRVIAAGRLRQRAWETPEGERRSLVELTADDVGPSLRWAHARPAKVDRVHQPDGQRPTSGGAFDDPPPL